MEIDIQNCNNIDNATIVIEEGRLNIKYAINGSGKSTIERMVCMKLHLNYSHAFSKDQIETIKELLSKRVCLVGGIRIANHIDALHFIEHPEICTSELFKYKNSFLMSSPKGYSIYFPKSCLEYALAGDTHFFDDAMLHYADCLNHYKGNESA